MPGSYQKAKEQVLRSNDLREMVTAFEASNDRVWYIDRPAIDHDQAAFEGVDILPRELGIRLALDLLRDWSRSVAEVKSVLISRPFVRIEDAWLSATDNATPPSVSICLAKVPELLQPGSFEIAVPKDADLDLDIDFSDMEFRYMAGFGGGHSWLVRDL